MSTTRLPELPQGQGREELSAWPGMGNRDFTADQMHAYGLAVWKAAQDAAAKVCDDAHPDDWPFLASAIRALPLPEQGSPQ